LRLFKKPRRNEVFLYGFLAGIITSAIFFILSLLLPTLTSTKYYQRSLNQLRNQAKTIKKEFSGLINHLDQKQKLILNSPFPSDESEVFNLLKKLDLNPETEGVGYYADGRLTLWLGNILDFGPMIYAEGEGTNPLQKKSSFLIKHKSSVYLIALEKIREAEFVIFYRILAFIPEFKTPYLKEYHFVRSSIQTFEKMFPGLKNSSPDMRMNTSDKQDPSKRFVTFFFP